MRNGEQNEDEAGTPNMRGGRTNYFIFPGEMYRTRRGRRREGALRRAGRLRSRGLGGLAPPLTHPGLAWPGLAWPNQVAFEADGKQYACDPFVFVPHEAL